MLLGEHFDCFFALIRSELYSSKEDECDGCHAPQRLRTFGICWIAQERKERSRREKAKTKLTFSGSVTGQIILPAFVASGVRFGGKWRQYPEPLLTTSKSYHMPAFP
eukprot:g36382.t1